MQGSLNTTSGGGTQAATQNPQSATADNSLTSSQGNLQSGSVNLLTGTNGVALKPTSLPSVAISPTTSTIQPKPVTPIKHHHVNGILLGIVIIVFVAAMAIFWKTTLAAKNTTE